MSFSSSAELPPTIRKPLRLLVLAALLAFANATCGGRTELDVPPPLPPQPECDKHEDCPGFEDLCNPTLCIDTATYEGELPALPAGVAIPPRVCLVVDPLDCDDNDPCTTDSCDALSGLCTYGPATLDLDGDGFNAPRPGTQAGEPGSCGDDCNDASDKAFPGNTEVCDGVDNDCNGVVDDNASYVPLDLQPIRISGNIAPAGPGGLAFNGESYISVYTGTTDGFDMYRTRLLPDASKVAPIEEQIAVQNADSAGGPVVWVGDRYGLAWQDRRDGNYEVYFTLLNDMGDKAIADVRLSDAPGFSVNVQLAWNGSEFIVVWQDDRNGLFEVLAQRVSVDGVPIGKNVLLSNPEGFNDEAPSVASGTNTIGVAFANGQAGVQAIRFRTFEQQTLKPVSALIDLTNGQTETVYPTVIWNEDRYIIAWYDRSAPVKAIYGMAVGEDGSVLTPAVALTSPGGFRSRYPSLLPLGDRLLLVYSDDRDNNTGYELYTRMLSAQLQPLSPESRLTNAPFNSITPISTFGPDGNVGILFRDDRDGGEHHVWFTRLDCVTAP